MKKIVLLALGAVGFSAAAQAQVCVFDTMTGPPTITDTGGLPRSMKGMAFSLGNTGAGPVTISGMDFNLVNVSGTNVTFTTLELDVSFWDLASNATAGTGAAFSNRLATYTIGLTPGTYNSGFYYSFGPATPGTPAVTFGTPFVFSGSTNLGVQMLVRGDSGQGLVAQDFLTPAVQTTLAPTTGAFTANPTGSVFGFYRNASQPNATLTNPDTSLLGSDFRTFAATTNIGLSMRLYTPVPEPASMAVLGFGALALIRRRKKA